MNTVTVEMLKAKNACKNQLATFRELFGEKAEFTPENQDKAERAGLDVFWFYWVFKLTGKAVRYYKDGTVAWIENYKNGKRHGGCVGYYPDGSVKWRENYKNGELIECYSMN